ncbi:MAG: type I 3-dehydroquinate dehydratase [Treponemataceae bacterium]|nr:MAG: type I 3-dehydroquinate dehydratase [Treponemataceae bacterium]
MRHPAVLCYTVSMHPKICMTLTGKTLAEDLALVNKYRKYIDLVELRADFLEADERLLVRDFPAMAELPCILTIRRALDGGRFTAGEASRTMLFARTLAFGENGNKKKFDYVDFEDDFFVPSLQDAAAIGGVRIIRSFHNMKSIVRHIGEKLESMRFFGNEIPKIACRPQSLHEAALVFGEVAQIENIRSTEQIICLMGEYGFPSRVLAKQLNSYLSYSSPEETLQNIQGIGHCSPITLEKLYRYHSINEKTAIFGIIGYPLDYTRSPELHNAAYAKRKMNAVYLPLKAQSIYGGLEFAKNANMQGLSVTVPYKEMILPLLHRKTESVESIGACNTLVMEKDGWAGYNTDASGFEKAILEFCAQSEQAAGKTSGKSHSVKRVAIIGAGGAAKAVAYTAHRLHWKACIFNRTVTKAKRLAEKYGFKYAKLSSDSYLLLEKYSELIIQTTSKGLIGSSGEIQKFSPSSTEENDPLFFYEFTGKEELYDLIYSPEVTPVMSRAKRAGCHVENGYKMLEYQAEEQIELFAAACKTFRGKQ